MGHTTLLPIPHQVSNKKHLHFASNPFSPRFEKLTKVLPIGGMVDKYTRMIATFRSEMDRVTRFFKKQQNNAPVPRNFPETSGRIYWVRSLLYHLKHFIDHFEEEENLKKMPEYRKLVKQYNDTGVFLMKFELQEQVFFVNPHPISFLTIQTVFRRSSETRESVRLSR